MKSTFFLIILFSILIYIVIGFTNYSNTYMHESAHEQIMLFHGCDEVEIKYKMYGLNGGSAQCIDINHTISDNERDLHMMNEIVGYNMTTLCHSVIFSSMVICLCIIIVGFVYGNKKNSKK